MRRDLDLLRNILLGVEASDGSHMLKITDFINDIYDEATVSYHIELLVDAKYIEAKDISSLENQFKYFLISRLTMQGHDYLDAVRNDNVWAEIKKQLKDFAVSAPLDLIKTVGSSVLSQMIGM